MKVILDEKALRIFMAKKGILTYKQLCYECGISYSTFCSERSAYETISKEYFWLLADRLDCNIDDLQILDWTK